MSLALSIEKPLFLSSTRPLMVRQDGHDIGYIKRWYRKTAANKAYDPKDQVHVSVFARNYEIEITENRSSFARGKQWEIRIAGNLTGYLVNNESLKDPHAIKLQVPALPEIAAEARGKNSGEIAIDGEVCGETYRAGRYIPTKYEAALNGLPQEIDPLLVAGILYVYWLAM
ncbi:hypothetical protein [Salisediminibacterium halotolerans]|uniref:Uncharacterized protein n=1 Tax=Salisediminibacterium halotolerans TaxID=517425 RepID=A0A1H9R5B1_9BACI|nr:hypothetical protein [Salisediminibacterium haloalkalitolerans]SER67797.1 hypothetical protein SAMN05444126_10431 [Salisediminibacterium haloalkalitolerans]